MKYFVSVSLAALTMKINILMMPISPMAIARPRIDGDDITAVTMTYHLEMSASGIIDDDAEFWRDVKD